MSGVGEAGLVLGLISSVIAIVEAANEIYEAAGDNSGLSKNFRTVADQLPLICSALRLAEQNIQAQKVDEQGLECARPVLEQCKESASTIKSIFEKTVPGPGASRAERMKKAMRFQVKSNKVKEEVESMAKSMELLAQHQVFEDAATLDSIKAAIEQLSSLPDEEGQLQFIHSGAGAINANTGTGQQTNYNHSGSGKQYNAHQQIFGRDQVDHQTNINTYHYYLEERRVSSVQLLDHRVDSPYSFTASERGFLATIGPQRYIDIPERVKGTCVWSTETIQYHSWVQSSRPSILWVTGGAGTGKTTLTNYLIECVKEKHVIYSGGPSHCSFFCSRDTEGQHDVGSLLQDLVLQLIERSTKVLRRIKSTYGITKQDHSWSFETTWRMFESTVTSLPSQQVHIMIDALDECDDDLSSRLLQKLVKLLGSMTNSARVNSKRIKLIISGQPQIRTAWALRESLVDHYHIDIEEGGHLTQDVALFVDEKIAELIQESFCSEKDGRDLRELIDSKSENSFLWLNMAFENIRRDLRHHSARFEDILSQLSEKLQPTYAKYLPPVGNDQIPFLQYYLRLFVASSRPLTFAEIDIFTSLQDQKVRPFSPVTAKNGAIVQASIQRALGPLVRFPQGTAQFIHSTAKDFFVLLAQQPSHNLHVTHGTDLTKAHLFCFRSCVKYLLHESIPRDLFEIVAEDSPSIKIDSPASSRREQDEDADSMIPDFFDLEEVQFMRDQEVIETEACVEIRQRVQAYDYAATNWAYHLAKSETLADDDDIFKAIDLLSPASGHLQNWYRYLSQQSQRRMPSLSESSPIILAAMFNLTRPVNVLYQAPNHQPSLQDLSSALYWAASRGSVSMVKLLLDRGAPVTLEQAQRVPLAVAAQGNHSEICDQLLAASDVNPNQIGSYRKPALTLAAEADHVNIVRLLLSHTAIDVNLSDLDGQMALIVACRSGSSDAVRALREDGRADVNVMDAKGQSPLHHASRYGDLATLKELVKFSQINVGTVDKNGRNAISIAAQEGHLQIVRALHNIKVDAARVDRNGRNALSWAANSFKATQPVDHKGESVLGYLVRKYPREVDVPDEDGWTPLAWSLDTPGYIRSALILTQCSSVDINRRDEVGGKCILAWAASAGMIDIVRCLLRRSDLEVDRPSFDGQTALASAAANGMIEAVKLLLQMGNASPHQPDHAGRTPADWAELNGFTEIAAHLRAIPKRAG